MQIKFDVEYKIGQMIETECRKYRVIGYEYMPQRALRYVLLYIENGKALWEYWYDYEIEMLKLK